MKLPKAQSYVLRLKPKKSYEVQLLKCEKINFQSPATLVCGKLYVVMKNQKIHYVGITNRPASARINYGLKATGRKNKGYHGYRWKNLKGELRLLVWSFKKQKGKPFLRELETVEAEFAYLVRAETKKWPLSQTEIHFYNSGSIYKKVAQKILQICQNEAKTNM